MIQGLIYISLEGTKTTHRVFPTLGETLKPELFPSTPRIGNTISLWLNVRHEDVRQCSSNTTGLLVELGFQIFCPPSNVKYIPWVANQDKKRPEMGEKEPSSPSWQQQSEESSVFNCLGPRIQRKRGLFKWFYSQFQTMSGIPSENPQEVEAVNQSWQVQSMSEPGRQGRSGSPRRDQHHGPVQSPFLRKSGRPQQSWPSQATYPTGKEFPKFQVELGKENSTS